MPINLLPSATIPPYRKNYHLTPTEERLLQEMIDSGMANGTLVRSSEPTASPIFFAKQDGRPPRPCVDYRAINAASKRDSYPLPNLPAMIDRLAGKRWYTKLDLKAAYNQLQVREGDEWITAFRCKFGTFSSRVVTFGLAGAPPWFQRFMDDTLRQVEQEEHYLDDVAVATDGTQAEHIAAVREVLVALAATNLYVNPTNAPSQLQK